MTFEQIEEAIKEAAEDLWMKIGNPKLPKDIGIAAISGAMYGLLGKEIDQRNGHIKSMAETAEEIRRDTEAIRQLIQEKDERIAYLEKQLSEKK